MRLTFPFLCILVLFLASGALAATHPSYAPRQWTVRDGLPTNLVYGIVQTRDGYLWMGTTDGVVRFDGARMRVFDAGNTEGLVNNLLPYVGIDPDGDVWAWGSAPWVSTLETRARTFGPEVGMPRIGVRDPLLESDGRVWIPTGRGLMRVQGDRVEHAHPDLEGKSVARPHRTRSGVFLVPVIGEGFFTLQDDVLTRVGELLPSGGRLHIQEGADGVVWLPLTAGLARWVPGESEPQPVTGLPSTPITFLELDDRSGNLWVGSRDGLFRGDLRTDPPVFTREADAAPHDMLFAGDGSVWTARDSVVTRNQRTVYTAPSSVLSLFEDREGNVWVGTGESGVVRLRRTTLGTLYPQVKIDNVIDDGGGGLLMGASDGSLIRMDLHGETVQQAPPFWALHRDSQGRLWGGNASGLFRFNEDGWENVQTRTHVHSIAETSDGWLWVTGQAQIDRLRAGRWETFTPKEGTSNGPMHFCGEGPDGSVWIGSPEGLFRYRHGQWAALTEADGLSSNRVFSAFVDRRGVVWAGTEGRGLNRIELSDPADIKSARITRIMERDGLFENGLLTVTADAMGRLWCGSNRGIFWVPLEQLDAFAGGTRDRIHCTVYTENDGLVSAVGNDDGFPNALEMNGHLYLTTDRGLAAIHLSQVVSSLPELPVVLEAVQVAESSIPVLSESHDLAKGQREFEITYTAPTFIDPENVRFRYRLIGFRNEWVEAGSRRTAYFTNVPPGRYRFEVMASQGSGGWGRAGTQLALSVPAFFHETPWFRGLMVLVGLGLVIGGVVGRGRLAARRQRELQETVRERTTELETARAVAEQAREAETRERELTDEERRKAEAARRTAEEARETAQRQAKRLLELDQAKSRFFANVSHEFRTPLTLTIGPVEDVLSGMHGDLSDEAKQELRIAVRSSHSVLDLVNQILDLAKLEAGELTLQRSEGDLGACVNRASEAFVSLAERRGVTLTVDLAPRPVRASFDETHLGRVITNLLSNAFKFTGEGGTVSVSLRRVAASDGDEAVITVSDTGVGIGESDLERIFDRFYQAHSGQHDLQPGTGIGLSLARELVDLHGGRIEVESTEGKGTSFRVVLHTEREPMTATAPVAGDASCRGPAERAKASRNTEPGKMAVGNAALVEDVDALDRTTVLIVEDHPEVRALVRKHLGSRYRVVEAADGEEALALARQDVPDLILSDVMMPKLDGFGLVRALKDDPELDYVPVILLTARDAVEDRMHALGIGVDDYLAKPFHSGELAARVENLIRSRKTLRERFAEQFGVEPATNLNSADENYLAQVTRAINERLADEDFNVAALAGVLGQGRSQMFKRVKDVSGKTPTDLIKSLRLERAKRMLEAKAGTVSEIAYGVGFKSVSHFSRSFRETFGAAPGTWTADDPSSRT